MTALETIFDELARSQAISVDHFHIVFEQIMSGALSEDQIKCFLLELENTGVSKDILAQGVKTMREKMTAIQAPLGAVDIVGTGGDGHSTYNISTTCCFVVAGAGVPVAKHGNRAVSSKSGASDVLRALGIKLEIPVLRSEACLRDANVTFLFAPNHHRAMKYVGPARAALGVRTIFNRLGPLCNPANVQHFVLGVYNNEMRTLYADTVLDLGIKHALIVHGADGMDEITTTDKTFVSEIKDGKRTDYEITPEDFGIKRASLAALTGGDAQLNARALTQVLSGAENAYRDIVLFNSGAAIYAADKASSIDEGISLARKSLDSGAAMAMLEKLVQISNG